MKRNVILLVAVVGVVAFGAARASASSAPIVIPYEKMCDQTVGHCESSSGSVVTIEMQVDPTTFRATGHAAQFTLTEWITVGDISFTAVMNAHRQPGRVHRAERHGHGGLVRGRAGPPAKQLRERPADRV